MPLVDWTGASCAAFDATAIDGEHGGRIATNSTDLAGQQGLHDQSLDRADEQYGGGIHVQLCVQFSLRLTFFP